MNRDMGFTMYTIKRLILNGNKRLMLNNIQEIDYLPTSLFQIIIGTNGSGKSSLLRELSPLPAFQGDYLKDGFKTIELEDGNDQYSLHSKNNKHTFIKNGEYLNENGTAQVQKELVKRFFNYTDEIHDVLVGDEELTAMSPQRRREWFTRLTPNNIQYAIDVFNTLKSRHRETQGALAHVNRRLTTETNALLSLTDVDNLESRVRQLQEDVVVLLENKNTQAKPINSIEGQLNVAMGELFSLSSQIIKFKLPDDEIQKYGSLENLQQANDDLEQDIKLGEQMLVLKTNEYNDLEVLLKDVQKAGVSGYDELIEKERKIHQQIEFLNKKIKRFSNIPNVDAIVFTNDNVITTLNEILRSLPDNDEGLYTREKIQEAVEFKKHLESRQALSKGIIGRSEQRYEHLAAAKISTCPKCNYAWKPGVSEDEMERLQNSINEAGLDLEHTTHHLTITNEFLDKADEYVAAWRVFKNFTDANPNFRPLFDTFLEDRLIHRQPKKCFDIVVIWNADIDYNFQLSQLDKELLNIKTAVAAAETIKSVSGVNAFNDRVTKLTEEINGTVRSLKFIKQAYLYVSSGLSRIKTVLGLWKQVEDLLVHCETLYQQYQVSLRNTVIEETLYEVNTNLGVIQTKLSEKQTLENIIADLNRDAENLIKDQEAFKLLMDELSPVSGLIADQLMGNVGCIVSQMNEIIAQMWTYDMEVFPCGHESLELDYKFPLKVPSKDIHVFDIAKGSTAQKDVINFAFKLVVMLYLNMSNFPLFLDETGNTFDVQHRTNLMAYIKLLIDSKRFSQLFMVSHLATQYGSMTQAEVCVLDDTNISTSMVHNLHVKIK